ncbi:MAG: LamG-like jellyroll fold domain-containing protein [Planctomycetaceae bacterium]
MPDGLLQGTTTETVEAWFNTTSGGVIIGMQNTPVGGSPSDWQPVLYVGNDGLLRGKFWDGRATQGPMTSSVAVNDGNWHHVAIVADFDNQNLYLDGNLIASVSGFISHQSSNYCQIGTGYTASSSDWPSGNGEWFDFEGRIDDVRVWNVARTQAEISSARNTELTGNEAGLAGYWKLNDVPGTNNATGFFVRYVESSVGIHDLQGALSVLSNTSLQTVTANSTSPVINYLSAESSGGQDNYDNDSLYPTQLSGVNVDNFVIEATGTVIIPSTGLWTFGVNSDDGFSLQLERNGTVYSSEYSDVRPAADTLATFDINEAGEWTVRLVVFDEYGQANAEFFAAEGMFTSFVAGSFNLVGDTSAGGLQVLSVPTPSATFTFANNSLTVLGTSQDDTITIRNDAGVIKIDANGSVIDTGLSAAGVTSVSLSGGGGMMC